MLQRGGPRGCAPRPTRPARAAALPARPVRHPARPGWVGAPLLHSFFLGYKGRVRPPTCLQRSYLAAAGCAAPRKADSRPTNPSPPPGAPQHSLWLTRRLAGRPQLALTRGSGTCCKQWQIKCKLRGETDRTVGQSTWQPDGTKQTHCQGTALGLGQAS